MIRPRALLVAVLLFACGEEEPAAPIVKGVVHREKIATSAIVKLNTDTGIATVEVPFLKVVPAADAADLNAELGRSVSFLVRSDASGTTANLVTGKLVAGAPAAADEFSVALNTARDLATVSFFNRTSAGLSLAPGRAYAGLLVISQNDYIENFPLLAFAVTVQKL